MSNNRAEYQRLYYERTKETRKAKRKKSIRTKANIAAEERYREKQRLMQEIAEMHAPTIYG